MARFVTILPVLFLMAILRAQGPAFEVASVKPNHTEAPRSVNPGMRNGKFTTEKVSLKTLLQTAYEMQGSRISGPDWLDTDRFDLAAKAPDGAPAGQMAPMLRTLLQERFRVVVHRESREMAAYDMVAAKGGVKIRPYDREHPPVNPVVQGGSVLGGNDSMPGIADALARPVGRPVIDRTGMEGRFYYFLNYARENDADLNIPDLFTAVQQQMGLKLEARRQSVEILVVDHAERVPTEN